MYFLFQIDAKCSTQLMLTGVADDITTSDSFVPSFLVAYRKVWVVARADVVMSSVTVKLPVTRVRSSGFD